MQSTPRRGLTLSSLLAAAAIAGLGMPVSEAPTRRRPRRAGDPSPPPMLTGKARAGRRDHAPGWHDPQRLAAANVKRARKAARRLDLAGRGAFGAEPYLRG